MTAVVYGEPPVAVFYSYWDMPAGVLTSRVYRPTAGETVVIEGASLEERRILLASLASRCTHATITDTKGTDRSLWCPRLIYSVPQGKVLVGTAPSPVNLLHVQVGTESRDFPFIGLRRILLTNRGGVEVETTAGEVTRGILDLGHAGFTAGIQGLSGSGTLDDLDMSRIKTIQLSQ